MRAIGPTKLAWTRQAFGPQLYDPFIRCGWPTIYCIRSDDNGVELMLNDGADRLIQRSYLANRDFTALIQELAGHAHLKNAERLQGLDDQFVDDRGLPGLGLPTESAPLDPSISSVY